MANVNTVVSRIYSATASDSAGTKIGFIKGIAKVAQNDTITLTNVSAVIEVIGLGNASTGAAETRTFATNVITCTSTTTGMTVSGLVIYR